MTRALGSEFTDADDSPGLMLWRVSNAWLARQRAALRPFDLTHAQFVLLASLTWLQVDGPVTQRAVSDHAHTDPMTTSQVLRALEAKGLVKRLPHPSDARARALVVTQSGATLANLAKASVEEVDRTFFKGLGSQVPKFARMLHTLANS